MLAPLATAQQPQTRVFREGGNWAQEITGSITAARNLKVKVDVGSVRVQGGSQQAIDYVIHTRAYTSSEQKARREFDSYKISAYVRGDTAFLVAEWEGSSPRKFSGDFVLNVPRNIDSVNIETDGGSVTGAGISGRMNATSGGGSIRFDDIGGAASAETGGGSINVSAAKGKITAESGGGSVKVVSVMQGAILETGGGSIEVERCAGQLKATTGGGSIELGDIGGAVEMETGGGSIRLASAKGPVRAETGGGSIELNGVPSARAETGGGGIVAKFVSSTGDRTDSLLETSAGDITVYLVSNLSITIRASIEMANGHKIHSDFSEIAIVTEGDDGEPKTITGEGNLNGGGPVLKVRTTTGDIWLRRTGR